MSISKKLVVTLEDDVATPSERIFIYKGDVGVDIIIELENFNYKIDSISEKNMINRIEAYFKNPQGIVRQYNDEVDVINGDRIKFSFSKNVINDMQIIGQYELQFHLFDKENNRITIPSYYFYVKEPLHNTSEEQEYDSRVDYAIVDYSKVKDDIVLFEVSENGYIKTNWQSGDLITSAKLNKIEAQLEINTNRINGIQQYDDTELNNSLNRLSETIENLNIPTKTSELENDSDFTTNSYVNEMLGGKRLVYLTQAEYDILTEEEKNNENIVYNITDIDIDYVTEEELNNKEYATQIYVSAKIAEAQLSGGEVDLSAYATKDDLKTKIDYEIDVGSGIELPVVFDGSYNSLTDKPEIPSLEGYATETYVNNKISEAQLGGGGVDLSNYATLEQVDEKISQSNTLETDMTVINSIGGISAGSNLNGMTTLEILNKLIFPYVAPTYSAVGTPNGGFYEKGNNQVITNVKVTVTKKSEKITKIEVFDGSTSLGYLEGVDIENGGTFNFNVNVEVNSINKQLTVTITDASNNSYTTKTGTFNFIYPYYVGVCEVNDEITETLIKGLTKRIETKGSKSISYTTNNQKMVFAYPSSYGNIVKILDPNSFDVTNTFNKTAISIIGLDGTAQNYYVYTNSASTVTNFAMKFNY